MRSSLAVVVLWCAIPSVALLQPSRQARPSPTASPTAHARATATATPVAEAKPPQVVEAFYTWIFQVSVPMPWAEVLRGRRNDLSDVLWATLREQARRGGGVLEFDPFLDSESGAAGFRILRSEVRGEVATVSVVILGATNAFRLQDRTVDVELEKGPDGWKIRNVFYHWAEREDLISLCRRKSK